MPLYPPPSSPAGGPVAIGDVTGLQDELEALSAVVSLAEVVTNKGAPGGYAALNVSGAVPGLALESVTADPVAPVVGEMWFRTDL